MSETVHCVLGFDMERRENKNFQEIKVHIERQTDSILGKDHTCVLANIASSLKTKYDINLDEDDVDCQKGKDLHNVVVSQIQNRSVGSIKGMLSLQGELWQMWANLSRKRQKPTEQGRRSPKATSKLNHAMSRLRYQQYQAYDNKRNLSQSLVSMITTAESPMDLQYCMQWLKIMIDDKSRDTLPSISRQFRTAWNALQNFMRTTASMQQPIELERYRDDVDKAEQTLAEASVGVEHFFRELCPNI